MKFNGVTAPEGEGVILEAHLDIQQTSPDFITWLETLGFENDPFASFFPQGYVRHMTGRIRVHQQDIKGLLPEVNVLIRDVVGTAITEGYALYTEVEIVQEILRFDPTKAPPFERVLDGLIFIGTGKNGGAKADIHVEFDHECVPEEVRQYLIDKKFYWVSTPETHYFPPEDIATLQTSTYHAGKRVCDLLSGHPLPGCKDIHLEQKLSMVATNYNLVMPEVIRVE